MNATNLQVYLQVQAILVRIEGMKAINADRIAAEQALAYTEEDFEHYANEIDSLMREVSHV